MLELLSGFITMVAAVGVTSVGYLQSRRFVSKRLRYVDQAQSPAAPVIAGVAAGAVAVPVMIILPFVGVFTAMLFGLSVGFGTRAGIKSFSRGLIN